MFIIPECRRALLHKGTVLLVSLICVSLLSFAAGMLFLYLNRAEGIRLEPKLLAAIVFVENYREQSNRLPTKQEFDTLKETHGNVYSFDTFPAQPERYLISVWSGDEDQIYDSHTCRLVYRR